MTKNLEGRTNCWFFSEILHYLQKPWQRGHPANRFFWLFLVLEVWQPLFSLLREQQCFYHGLQPIKKFFINLPIRRKLTKGEKLFDTMKTPTKKFFTYSSGTLLYGFLSVFHLEKMSIRWKYSYSPIIRPPWHVCLVFTIFQLAKFSEKVKSLEAQGQNDFAWGLVTRLKEVSLEAQGPERRQLQTNMA